MVARGAGRVINVSSGAGLGASVGFSGYGVSKTALNRLTEDAAAELRRTGASGVSCFAIGPGLVRTPLNNTLLAHPLLDDWAPWFRKAFDEGRDDPPEAAAGLVVRLCSLPDGEAAALSGRFVSVRDNFTSLLRNAGADENHELHTLRLVRAS